MSMTPVPSTSLSSVARSTSSLSIPFQALDMSFWRSTGTDVSAYSCALSTATGADLSTATSANTCLPHLTLTLAVMSVDSWCSAWSLERLWGTWA
ncbi:hypothetical protein PF003_g4497 [Phytophthora fragariae]|nr:hypothetical protein PF003_g4497 [Phytophthora fragariae]